MMDGFKKWLAKPFSVDMSAVDWFLFFGLIIAISTAWQLVLRHLYAGIRDA